MHPHFSHWVILVATHVFRSLWDDWGQQSLKSEITTLRVEVHRAKELVADYNYVLDTCELTPEFGSFGCNYQHYLGTHLCIYLAFPLSAKEAT